MEVDNCASGSRTKEIFNKLLNELNKGKVSGEEEGYVDSEEVWNHILDMNSLKNKENI